MSSRRPSRSAPRPASANRPGPAVPRRRRWLRAVVAVVILGGAIGLVRGLGTGARLKARAEAAEAAHAWAEAAETWRAFNRGASRVGAATLLREARACLSANLAAGATEALTRANQLEPAEPRAWLLRLELLRLQDRPLEALSVGRQAQAAVPTPSRAEVLFALTLALLADVPEVEARTTLGAWSAADPGDLESRLALLRRMAGNPAPEDPSRPERITELEVRLRDHPRHAGLREALVAELADAGEPDRGRAVLAAWPADIRDAREARLRGRWALEYDHQPAVAVEALTRALRDLPQDGPTRYRLARALSLLGRDDEARAQARILARLREATEPNQLGSRLEAARRELDGHGARQDLGELCRQVGLTELAEAWDRAALDVSR